MLLKQNRNFMRILYALYCGLVHSTAEDAPYPMQQGGNEVSACGHTLIGGSAQDLLRTRSLIRVQLPSCTSY